MSENSVKAVAATKETTTSTHSASTSLNSAQADEASSFLPTSLVQSSAADDKQPAPASGLKRVIRTITVIDPRKLQQAGLDRKLAEAIRKQRLTATQAKPIIARAVTPKTQTTTSVATVSNVAPSATPAAAAPTTTVTSICSTAVTRQLSQHVAAVATKKATGVKPLPQDQKVLPKITITRPTDLSIHPTVQLSTKTERLAHVKNLLQRKILTKLQPGSALPSASSLPTTSLPIGAMPFNPTSPGARAPKTSLPVAPKWQTPPPSLVTTTATPTVVAHSTTARAAPKQTNQTNITVAKKLPLDVARINKLSAASREAPRTHVQSYEHFLTSRLSGTICSRLAGNYAGNDSVDDDIPKASIKARKSPSSQNRAKPPVTAVKPTAVEFIKMSPLKQPYPVVSLAQGTPLPHISTFKKPLPVALTPTIKTESPEYNTQQPAMKQCLKSLIVLENKVLSQDEKIDITALRLAKPNPESSATSSALAFSDVIIKEEQAEEFQYISQHSKKESNVVVPASHSLQSKQDVVPKQDSVKELEATSQLNKEEPQAAASQLNKLPVPEDQVEKETSIEERVAKSQNSVKKKVILIPAHKLKLALSAAKQSIEKEFQTIPANSAKDTKTICLSSNKLKSAQDTPCVPESGKQLSPIQQQLLKEKKVFILSPNKLKLSQSKIPAFAKEIKLQAATGLSGILLKAPGKSDTQSEQQSHSTKQSESTTATVLDSASVKLEFKEPLPPAHKPLCAYSDAFRPQKKSTVEIVEQPLQESTLSAVDFIASLATTNPITEETELELSPEELNLNASFAMNLSPIRIPYPHEKQLLRESVDDSMNASGMLADIFDSNAGVEIGKIITIPADNVLNTVIAADKSGQVITIASNKSLAMQSADVGFREAHEDHSCQHECSTDDANVASIEGNIGVEVEKSKHVVVLQQKAEEQIYEVISNTAKQLLEFSAGSIPVSSADVKQSLEKIETEPPAVTSVELDQIDVGVETKLTEEESANEQSVSMSSLEKLNSNNDDSAGKRLPRFRRGKVNLVQRRRTNAASITLPISDRKSKGFVDVDVSHESEEAGSVDGLQTADAVSFKPDTAPDAADGSNLPSLHIADDMLNSPSLRLIKNNDFDIKSAKTCEANTASKRSTAEIGGGKVEVRPKSAEVDASFAAEHPTDDVASNENITEVLKAETELVANETVAKMKETVRKQHNISLMLNPPRLPKRKESEMRKTTEKETDSTAAQSSVDSIPVDKTASLIQPKNDECELALSPAKNPFRSTALRGVNRIGKQSNVGIKTLLNHMELAKLGNAYASSNTLSNETADILDIANAPELALVGDIEELQALAKKTLKRRASTCSLSNAADKICANEESECATTSLPKKTKLATEPAERRINSAGIADTAHANVSSDDAPSATDQSSNQLSPVKINSKRKHRVPDDSKAQRALPTKTESEDDSDMSDHEDPVVFLGFNDRSPASSNTNNNLELLITAASIERQSSDELNPPNKQIAHAVSGTALKSWLTSGKAIAPTLTKCKEKEKPNTTSITRATTASRRSSVPLKKRWELLQNSQELDIEITDDTSPTEDDEEEHKLRTTAVKRSLGDRTAKANVAVKKIKFLELGVEGETVVDKSLDANDSSEKVDKRKQNTVSDKAIDTRGDLAKDISVEHADEKLLDNYSYIQKQETAETIPLAVPFRNLKTSSVHELRSRGSVGTKLDDITPPACTKSKADRNSKTIIEYFESHERRSIKNFGGSDAHKPDLEAGVVLKDSKILENEAAIQSKRPGRKSAILMSSRSAPPTALKSSLSDTANKLMPKNKDITETQISTTSVAEKKKPVRKSKAPAAETTVESKAILSVRTDLMEEAGTDRQTDPVKKSRKKSKFLETMVALEPPVIKKKKSDSKSKSFVTGAIIHDADVAGTTSSCTKVHSDLVDHKDSALKQLHGTQAGSFTTAREEPTSTANDTKKNPGRKSKSLKALKLDAKLNSTALDYETAVNEDQDKPRLEYVATNKKKSISEKVESVRTLDTATHTNSLAPDKSTDVKKQLEDSRESEPVKLKKKPGRKPKSMLMPSALEYNTDSTSNTNTQRDATTPVLEKKKPGRKSKSAPTASYAAQNAESTFITFDLLVSSVVSEKKKPGRKPKLKQESPVHNASLDTSALSQSQMSAPVVEKKKPGRKPKLKPTTPIQTVDSSTISEGTSGCESPVVKKKPGRKSLLPSSTTAAPFNPRILLITNRAQLDSDEPLAETSNTATTPGTVQCGLCLACVVRDKWTQHLATHYGVGWIVGEMPEIDLTMRNAVLNVMITYLKNSGTKELTCRMCGRQFRSALGILLHLEGCGASEVRVTCEYCSRDYSQLTMVSHRRNCAVRWESATKDYESTVSGDATTTIEVFNNVGRVKRASVQKAEKRLKALRHELVGAAAAMSIADAKKHIRLEAPGGSDLETKWNDDLQSFGVVRCLAKKCNFECKDAPTMKTHYENCEYKTETEVVYRCVLCTNGSMFPSEEAALKHITQQHATNEGNDFDGDSTDCSIRTDQESSGAEDDGSSGVDSNESKIEDSSATKAVVASTKGNRKNKSKASVTPGRSRSQVYPDRSMEVEEYVAKIWNQFVAANYSEQALFPYALPIYKNCCREDFERYLPAAQVSMKFCFVQKPQLPKTFGSAEQLTWTELDRFGTINSKVDHLMHTGGPVKTLAWVPLPSDVHEQYLLLSYRRDYCSYTRFQNPKVGTALLLLFEITYTPNAKESIRSQLHYALSIPDGPVHCTTFLPSGGYDVAMNRLGLLAVGTATSTIKVYALPLSVESETPLKQYEDEAAAQITVIELKPVIVLCFDLSSTSLRGHMLADTQCLQICWSETASHKHIFAGFSSGCVGIWDISDAGEDDNLNAFLLDDVRNIVPLNFFYLGEKGVRAMALHYDTTGPRWLAAVTGIRKVLCYDLRDLARPVLLMEELHKNHIHSLDWSPLWEPFVITVGDSLLTYGRLLQAVHVNNLQMRSHSKIAGTLSAASQVHYNPTISVLACTSDNGDVVFLNTRELHQSEVLRKPQKNGHSVSSIALKRLDGTAVPKFDSATQPPAGWQPNEPDYKEKYGLVFGPVVKCEVNDKTHYLNEERMPHGSLERYLRVSSLRWNLNSGAQQLVAVGYENGFVRLTSFKP